jgi:DNA (cytosine-5)-methyltransferase 1
VDLICCEADFFVAHVFLHRYIQVGNAVAVPVAQALGYSLGQAYQQGEFSGEQHPLFKLPGNFVPAAQATATRLHQGSPAGEVVEEE